MAGNHGIQKLSNELLKEVLDHIEDNPEHCINIDRRAYLSVESFRPPSPPLPSRAQEIANFRLVCRRFAESGIPYQFTRIATRFSIDGFKRKLLYNGAQTALIVIQAWSAYRTGVTWRSTLENSAIWFLSSTSKVLHMTCV